YAGLNQADKQRVGTVSTVGLQDVADVREKFELYLANALLVGGPFKVVGRTTLIEQDNPFKVAVQLAYKHHTSSATQTAATREQRYDAPRSASRTTASREADDEPMTRRSRYHH
ncbi:DUF6681 family protein, partial [Levilactobacillus namurensis]|nr:hypothetical protein [Levilactobacillus namurensis]